MTGTTEQFLVSRGVVRRIPIEPGVRLEVAVRSRHPDHDIPVQPLGGKPFLQHRCVDEAGLPQSRNGARTPRSAAGGNLGGGSGEGRRDHHFRVGVEPGGSPSGSTRRRASLRSRSTATDLASRTHPHPEPAVRMTHEPAQPHQVCGRQTKGPPPGERHHESHVRPRWKELARDEASLGPGPGSE